MRDHDYKDVMCHLNKEVEIKEMEIITYYLGIHVEKDIALIYLPKNKLWSCRSL